MSSMSATGIASAKFSSAWRRGSIMEKRQIPLDALAKQTIGRLCSLGGEADSAVRTLISPDPGLAHRGFVFGLRPKFPSFVG